MTEGCNLKVKSRGLCAKCYSTLRVMVRKGKITWAAAEAAGLCLKQGEGAQNLSPMQAAIQAAEEQGNIELGESQQVPAFDPDQEPEPAPQLPPAPEGFYYDSAGHLVPIPQVTMPAPVDASPQGYAAYDPNAAPAADAPHVPQPRQPDPPVPVDPVDALEEEEYLDDETPEQKARRKAIERRHKREQEQRYIEENGIVPPRNGNVVVVPPPKVNIEKNGEITTGYGAGPAEGLNIPPGIYVQPHEQAAPPTIDGEPLQPGWQLAPDGINLISPQGQFVNTTPVAPNAGQQRAPGQAIVLPVTNQPPANAQLIVPPSAVPQAAPAPLVVPQATPVVPTPPAAPTGPAQPEKIEGAPPWEVE
jgi:hypothetical protein